MGSGNGTSHLSKGDTGGHAAVKCYERARRRPAPAIGHHPLRIDRETATPCTRLTTASFRQSTRSATHTTTHCRVSARIANVPHQTHDRGLGHQWDNGRPQLAQHIIPSAVRSARHQASASLAAHHAVHNTNPSASCRAACAHLCLPQRCRARGHRFPLASPFAITRRHS